MSPNQPFFRRIELDRPDLKKERSLRGIAVLVSVFLVAVSLMTTAVAHTETPDMPEMPWVEERDQIERCLNSGEIVERTKIPVGVTQPEKVVLECGGMRIKAVFKRLPNRYASGWWESYLSEVAAYRLDRLLDLRMVPPTVTRKVGLTLGSMQYWVEGFAVFGDDPNPNRISRELWARIKMFDALLNNPDRNSGNILIAEDGRVALIDHSRAAVFRGGDLVRKKKRPKFCNEDMRLRIESLDEAQLHAELADLAQRGNLTPFLKRRDKLIEEMASAPVL